MMKRISSIEELERFRNSLVQNKDSKLQLRVCLGSGCRASGGEAVVAAFKEEIGKQGLDSKIEIKETGCHGFCEKGPLVIAPPDIFYQTVKPEDVEEIVRETLINEKIVERLLYVDPSTNERIVHEAEVPFYKKQMRQVLTYNGVIDPSSIEDYISVGGYSALAMALHRLAPEDVIDQIKRAGLRGRGGAGFSTGIKWELCKKEKGEIKYIVCNADEGDPGAYMDRSILEGNPHSVIEGMIIGAYATGAREGKIYVRIEYPLAIEQLTVAIKKAREYGFLGQNILGSGINFDIKLSLGAGAFVSGEETALIASIEGKKGVPKQRPPYPSQKGIWGHPTLINNVETFANVPLIISKGPDWYSNIGTENNTGTKIFSLVGNIKNTGLVEVPMGITLGEIVYDIGGGPPKGKKFKGVQTGGPSGGCIPVELLNVPVNYETLKDAGSIMGSGGMIVLDEDTCVVDFALYFLKFLQEESCGKCLSCRKGIQKLIEILTDICEGRGELEDLDTLEELATVVQDASLCGLGHGAPNPLLSTMKYFRDEYEAHIIDKRCPAGVCNALVRAPCQNACPVELDIPGYSAFIKEGRFEDAYRVIRQRLPFPSVCGRVCNHPCEASCARSQMDDPLAIMHLKRFVADYAITHGIEYTPKIKATQKEKVAIVGSGPAGLAAAYDLAREGYGVTVFEAHPVAGGMLTVGIPEYRLPREIVQNEINDIKRLGVDIKLNTRIEDSTELLKQGYQAVFIASGAWKQVKMGIPGEDVNGVYDAIEFLKNVNLGNEIKVGKKVIVIGGGNSAIDAARLALRKGADEVNVLYRREKKDMPAIPDEIEAADEENVCYHFLTVPTNIQSEKGRVTGVECIRMELKEFDRSGRKIPYPIEGSEYIVPADMVIIAIGQRADPPIGEHSAVEQKRGWMTVNPRTLRTTMEGVFAGGDVVTGGGTVIGAIAAGQRAASSIKRYLEGKELLLRMEREDEEIFDLPPADEEKELEVEPRVPIRHLHPTDRITSCEEVIMCYSSQEAVREAKRCLRCDYKEILL